MQKFPGSGGPVYRQKATHLLVLAFLGGCRLEGRLGVVVFNGPQVAVDGHAAVAVALAVDIISQHIVHPFPFQGGGVVLHVAHIDTLPRQQGIEIPAGCAHIGSVYRLVILLAGLLHIEEQAFFHFLAQKLRIHIYPHRGERGGVVGDLHGHDPVGPGEGGDGLVRHHDLSVLEAPLLGGKCQSAGLGNVGVPGAGHSKDQCPGQQHRSHRKQALPADGTADAVQSGKGPVILLLVLLRKVHV